MKGILIVILSLISFNLSAQDIFGTWRTIDDETGKAKSIVEIFEKDGKVYGKIIKVLNAKKQNPLCNQCKGALKGEPIIGMQIIDGLSEEDDVYEGGTILNPSNGKVYKCRLKLDSANSLQVRGYIAFFYKTQYWQRVK